jgi:hypothetical protein
MLFLSIIDGSIPFGDEFVVDWSLIEIFFSKHKINNIFEN